MKKHLIFCAISVLFSLACNGQKQTVKQELIRLDNALENRAAIEQQKRHSIDSLTAILDLTADPYEVCKQLYQEYRSYNYDTALFYVSKMHDLAQTEQQQMETDLCHSFVLLSGGLFKEAYDILAPMEEQYADLPDDYYITFARLMYDLADYAGGAMRARYNQQGHRYMQELVSRLSPADSAQYWYPLATIDLREDNYRSSLNRFKETFKDSKPTDHDRAIYTSSTAYLYRQMGDAEQALHYYIDAAIYDITSSTYETVALRMVAELLFEQGEIDEADRYIRLAMEDAQRYHARHRQVAISQLLPIIEQRYADRMRSRTTTAFLLFGITLLLLIVVAVSLILLIKRTKAIHAARQTIDDMNRSLLVANKLKEELLSSLMVGHSQFLNAVEKYQADVKANAVNRKWSELMSIPKAADARLQRQILNHRLDEMLLSIFPTFVADFNRLLRPDEQLAPDKNELMNTQLRIFALMRLGITHNEIIAEILDYSINTIYTYKTRTLNRSDLTTDQFYDALMHVPSFS